MNTARRELAAAYRLAERFGLNEGISNHFTLRVPGETERFLVIPHGLHWSEVRASRLLVVDGEGSAWCALLGDMVAEIASDNGWSGIVINGGVRDVSEVAKIEIGVKARFAVPRRSRKEGQGRQDTPLAFAGVTFLPGDYLYADGDGILIAKQDLLDTQV